MRMIGETKVYNIRNTFDDISAAEKSISLPKMSNKAAVVAGKVQTKKLLEMTIMKLMREWKRKWRLVSIPWDSGRETLIFTSSLDSTLFLDESLRMLLWLSAFSLFLCLRLESDVAPSRVLHTNTAFIQKRFNFRSKLKEQSKICYVWKRREGKFSVWLLQHLTITCFDHFVLSTLWMRSFSEHSVGP